MERLRISLPDKEAYSTDEIVANCPLCECQVKDIYTDYGDRRKTINFVCGATYVMITSAKELWWSQESERYCNNPPSKMIAKFLANSNKCYEILLELDKEISGGIIRLMRELKYELGCNDIPENNSQSEKIYDDLEI